MVDSSQYIGFYVRDDNRLRLWNCDNNVETRRSIWQSYFLGLAGGLEWDITKDLSIYDRARSFIEGVDLEGGNWHPGAFDRENDGEWKFNDNYHDDCIREDELADVVYLRSGDREKAFGVITNRRANYYTLGEGDCKDEEKIPPPVHSDPSEPEFTDSLQNYGSVSPGNFSNRLRLRNMRPGFLGLKEYKIKYYSPYDLGNSIKEETRFGSQHTLAFPDMDTLDVVLFEVFPMGENFKSGSMDTTDLVDSLIRESIKEEDDDVKIYPNPNNGEFIVFIKEPSETKIIYVYDDLGKIIDSRTVMGKENQYIKKNFRAGVYFIEVVFVDKVVRKKMIVN